MITKEEINNAESFNLPLLQEAMRQAELKIKDENDRKERIEKKVFFLLPFTAFCLYFLIKEVYYLPQDVVFKTYVSISLIISCSMILISSSLFVYLLLPQWYGGFGKPPHVFLNTNIINDNKNIFSKVLIGILRQYDDSIMMSFYTNNKKSEILKYAILFLTISPLPILFTIMLHLF